MTQWFFDNKCSGSLALVNSHCDSLNSDFANNDGSAESGPRAKPTELYIYFSLRLIFVHKCTAGLPHDSELTIMMIIVILLRFVRTRHLMLNGIDGTRIRHEPISLAHYTSFCRRVHLSICGLRCVSFVRLLAIFHYFRKLSSEGNCNKVLGMRETGGQQPQLIVNSVHFDYVALHWPALHHFPMYIWRLCVCVHWCYPPLAIQSWVMFGAKYFCGFA